MRRQVWVLFFLGVLFSTLISTAEGVNVAGVAPHLRMPKTALIHPLNYNLSSSEIRRPDQFEDNPRSQIAVWQPFLEPGPVTRTTSNMLTNDTRIFRNIGPTKDQFPYVVRVENGPDQGKFLLFKNVKYHWFFEQAANSGEPPDSNVPGESGGGAWSPFMNMRDANTQFILDMAEDKASKDDVWDKKLYVNRHMLAYDSGISGSLNYKDSTILQQVGMIMTYEWAEIPAPAVSGAGYPPSGQAQATADPVGDIPDTVNLTSVPDASAFQKKVVQNDRPDGYSFWNLKGTIDGVEYDKFSAYTLAYVEDHELPAIDQGLLNPEGNVYNSVVGGFLGADHSVNYQDDNPNAELSSQQLQSEFSYYVGMEDLYHLPDPFYDGVTNKSPVLLFYFLRSNDDYGPYVGRLSLGKERSWFAHRHPYWKNQDAAKRDKFIADRYANCWASNFMQPHEKGVIYYICCDDLGNGGIQTLNNHWKAKQPLAGDPAFQQLMEELNTLSNQAATEAKAALTALDNFLQNGPGDRSLNRFAFIGFQEDRGRCVIGPIVLEKDPSAGTHSENNQIITDPTTGLQREIKSGNWNVAEKRVIMPFHFATNSIEWHHVGNSFDVSAIQGKSSLEVKRYYQAWAQQPPDCLMEMAVSDCCGNGSPQGSIINVEDCAKFSKPMIDMEITDMNSGIEHSIVIPCGEELEAGAKLKVTDRATGAPLKEYEAFECDAEFDLAKQKWEVISANGQATVIGAIPEDASGPDSAKIITEDQRLQFTIKPYDNIDATTPCKGIVYTELEIEALTPDKKPTGQMEQLEYQDGTQMTMGPKIVKDGSGLDRYDLNEFDPDISFYHIFRSAGWYQIRAKTFDRGKTGGKGLSRELTCNINVLPASFKVREINTR